MVSEAQQINEANGSFALFTIRTTYSSDNFENDSVVAFCGVDSIALNHMLFAFIDNDSSFVNSFNRIPKFYFDLSSRFNFYSNNENKKYQIDDEVLKRFRFGEPDLRISKMVFFYNADSTLFCRKKYSIAIYKSLTVFYVMHKTNFKFVGCDKLVFKNKSIVFSKDEKENFICFPVQR